MALNPTTLIVLAVILVTLAAWVYFDLERPNTL
jgi:hypothetical protein